ncbi:MAG TPA: uridine kinase [Bacteroidetes bacterium]|nr:uridine kinase [Bacteroidota bacterium]
MKRPLLIGIAGGTGSGKTLIAESLVKKAESNRVVVMPLDAYYKDLRHLSFTERAAQNFDHPDAIDIQLLLRHLQKIVAGQSIQRPVYDFRDHLRQSETALMTGYDIIILEGILVLHFEELRKLLDIKIFVDTDSDIRLIRRLRRDVLTRNRSRESVLQQYEGSVRPMHLQFVEPARRYADLIIPGNGDISVALNLLQNQVKVFLD